MRILITSIVDLQKTAHNRLHQIVKHLGKNHDITVLSINDWWKAKQTNVKLYSPSFKATFQAINIKYLTEYRLSPILQEIFSAVALNKILKQIDSAKFDVHLNYNTLISGYFVAKKLKSARINTIYDMADDLPEMIRNSPQIPSVLRPLGKLVGTIMVGRNIRLSQKIVCTTDSLRDSYHVPQDKFEFVPNGVDTELFKQCSSQPLRNKLGIETDFVVGYVGVLREWVDFEPVFSALKHLEVKYPNMKVLIVGEEGGYGKIKRLARKHEILNKVVFTGTVPYNQVPEYISCMDVCLIPFRANAVSDNALPLKLFEYMACEKPVICSKLVSISQAVNNTVLYASNEKGYRDNLIVLYENRQLGKRMGVAGRKFVEQSYSWVRITSKLERVLAEARRL